MPTAPFRRMVYMQTNFRSPSKLRYALLIVVAILAIDACSKSGGSDTAPQVPVLTSVMIAASAQSVVAGQSVQLTGTPKDQSGSAIAASVAWSSSAASVATVNQSGLVTTLTPGVATITATATSGTAVVTGQITITVTPPPVLTSVTIAGTPTTITAGATTQLTASSKDQSGAAIAATVTWSSSATGKATVSSTGLVTGVAAGSATITASATLGGVTVTSNVVITISAATPVLTSVTISAPSGTVAVGSTLQFTAFPKDQFGNAMASTLTWSSSVIANATINSSGLVTGVATGSTNISVSATAGGVTAGSGPTPITVTSAAAAATVNATLSDTFSPNSVTINVGQSVQWNFATTHNVTFDGSLGAPADIPDTPSGSASATFNTSGTFNYQCTIHAGMTGKVIVN